MRWPRLFLPRVSQRSCSSEAGSRIASTQIIRRLKDAGLATQPAAQTFGPEGRLRIPGDAGQLFFAGFPFGAGKDARSHFDEAWSELENGGGVPRVAVARAIFADIERVSHAGERDVLDNHFGEEAKRLHFERIIFEVNAIGADA